MAMKTPIWFGTLAAGLLSMGCDQGEPHCIGGSVSDGGVCLCPGETAWVPSSGRCVNTLDGGADIAMGPRDGATGDAGYVLDAGGKLTAEDASDATALPTAEAGAGDDAGVREDGGGVSIPMDTAKDAAVTLVPDAGAPAKLEVWADWTAYDQSSARGSFNGVLGGLSLTYTGDIYNAQVNGGLPYWTPGGPYTSAAVPNPPDSSDMIMLAGSANSVQTLTFSAPVTDPVLAVFSLGKETSTAVLKFDDDFVVLSGGGMGYYGPQQPLQRQTDHKLSGGEASGVIGFRGTYTTIRWTTVINEPWYGVTVGVPTPP
jgi:hypothetical protein